MKYDHRWSSYALAFLAIALPGSIPSSVWPHVARQVGWYALGFALLFAAIIVPGKLRRRPRN